MVLSDGHTIRFQRAGISITKTLPTKAAATVHLAKCITSINEGALLPGEERLITWEEASKLFLQALDKRLESGKSKTTDRAYRSRLTTLTKTFGRRPLQSIERVDVENWIAERRKEGCGSSDTNSCLTTLHLVYESALDRYTVKRFPRLHDALTELRKVGRLDPAPGRDNILETEEQMQELLGECLTLNLYHFCYCILNTGLRHADVLKLRIPEISWTRNEIATTVKGKKAVRIPITENYGKFLKAWILRTRPTKAGWLFPSSKKDEAPFKKNTDFGFCRMKERVAKRYEAKGDKATAVKFRALVPHDLRHTFATHFLYKASKELGATAAVHILSQALGHSTSYITARYSHALDDVNQAAMKSYGQQMFGNVTNLFQSV